MKTQRIGLSDITSTRLAYGAWRLAGSEGAPPISPAEGRAAVQAAFDAGYTLFDHADIYGKGACEKIFGDVLKDAPAMRDQITLATKGGICPPWGVPWSEQQSYNSSAGHLTKMVETSLSNLRTDRIDLLMIHRPDYLGDPAEIAAAFTKLRLDGKVRWFGVSNFKPSQVAALQSACDFPLVANQVEVSLGALFTLEDGTLDQCLELKMTPLAWSPLFRNGFSTAPRDAKETNLHAVLDQVAARYGVTRAEIAIAWLLRHPTRMIPIVGSVKPERIRQALKAEAIEITRDEWYALFIAARGQSLA